MFGTVSPVTFGSLSEDPPHRSFFREALQQRAGARALDEWLVEEANVRGYFGAVGMSVPVRSPTATLSDAALIVALLMPHTIADGRLIKLVVRILQQGEIDPKTLWFYARRERAERVLYWLLRKVPEVERTGAIGPALMAQLTPPRGYRALRFNYDGSRLIRRPATKESIWRAARR